jgi:hypothetical protein
MVKELTDHEPEDEMPTEDEMQKVLDVIESLGMHGIMLLGKPCRRCGALHRMAIGTDLRDTNDVPHMLAHYAVVTANVGDPKHVARTKLN